MTVSLIRGSSMTKRTIAIPATDPGADALASAVDALIRRR